MRRILCLILAMLMSLSLMTFALASEEPETEETPEAAAEAAEEGAIPAEETPESTEEPASDGAPPGSGSSSASVTPYAHSAASGQMILDNDHWSYANGVWYQTGLVYCASPASTTYETLNIYVPGAYMSGEKNSTGYYTCAVRSGASVGSYTSDNAPYIMTVNTPGYSYQTAASGHSSYTAAGMIYIGAGCRGKGCSTDVNGGAPWGVTDLKAAIRFIRYSGGMLPGNTAYFFACGHSGGGAQTSVLGASGNSALYTPYLKSIGACMTYDDGTAISDAIYGAMAWCPITSLDMADAAYEWNLGQFARSGSALNLSCDLADAYAQYINALGLTDGQGHALTLEKSSSGEYAAGGYYDFLLSEIERSRQNYIADGGSAPSAVTTLSALVTNKVKSASKSVPAFDNMAATQTENLVFGDGNNGRHFDAALYEILSDPTARSYSAYSSYASAFASDLARTDEVGVNTLTRSDMYNPMYYLCGYYGGAGTADVAPHWRIHSGLSQGDTSLCVEMNLALALQSYGVDSLELEMVWGQGHTTAERTGSGTANFIAWVNDCVTGAAAGSGDFGSLYTPAAADDAPFAAWSAAGVLRYLAGLADAPEAAWDADGSGAVTLRDAVLLLKNG